MKESAGEANVTVITIVLIGIIAAIATPLITNLMKSTEKSSRCAAKGGVWRNGKCYASCDGVQKWSGQGHSVGDFCL